MKERYKIILGTSIAIAVFFTPFWYGYCRTLTDFGDGEMVQFLNPTPWQNAVCFRHMRKDCGGLLMVSHGRDHVYPSTKDEIIEGRNRALSGDIFAQNDLAKLYCEGDLVPADDKEAYYWFSLMAKTDAEEGRWRNIIPEYKASAAARLSTEEKNEVDAAVSAWQPQKQ